MKCVKSSIINNSRINCSLEINHEGKCNINKKKKFYFLCGLPRSGNTLFSSIMNQNPKISVTANSMISNIFIGAELLKTSEIYNNYPDEKSLDNITKKRRSNAMAYFEGINMTEMFIPDEKVNEFNTYHTFVVQTKYRDELKQYLSSKGIDTAIHYPIPIHLQPASKKMGYKVGDFPITEEQSSEILTLPVNQYLTSFDLKRIISAINQFEREKNV